MTIPWDKLLQIGHNWHESTLRSHHADNDSKLSIRAFTLKFSGIINDFTPLAAELSQIIHKYVFGKSQISKMGEPKAVLDAIKTFGKINPTFEGKYGELLLFALVESILRCPMVASKIPTSFQDQVKGGDGIFLGKYRLPNGKECEAILIGESKIWTDFSTSLDDALESLNRFHDSKTKASFGAQEFIVAKKNLFTDGIDANEIYDCLTPGNNKFLQRILVHPVFIMYETNKINTIENKATDNSDAELHIENYIFTRHSEHIKLIKEKLGSYDDLNKVYIDFFILPVKNVDEFKHTMYFNIHGVPYSK